MIKLSKRVKDILIPSLVSVVAVGLMCVLSVCLVSGAMVKAESDRILYEDAIDSIKGIDCIIVLGCQVKGDGRPSDMLRDRLDTAIELYKAGVSDRIIMSGDHGSVGYNEVGVMKKYAIEAGVPSEHIFMDHAGFSTYETMYRARDVFLTSSHYKRVIVVTQEYHLTRALYIANSLGLDAYGVSADKNTYRGQSMRDMRETLARFKDFLFCQYGAEPTFLGDAIPVDGNGDITNDKYYDDTIYSGGNK